MRNFTKRTAAIVGATVIAVGGGTAAFAYASGWFNGGYSASAVSSDIQDVTATVTVANTAENRLFPGKTINVTGTLTNPNDYAVKINSVEIVGVTSTKGGGNNGACSGAAANLSATLAATYTLTPGQSASNLPIGSLTMGQNAVKECAGSVITTNLKFNGELVAS